MRVIGWTCLLLLISCQISVRAQSTDTPQKATSKSKSTETEFLFRGHVVDTKGNPIEGATVLVSEYGNTFDSEIPPKYIKQTDSDGKFEILFKKIVGPRDVFDSEYLWAYKTGYDLRCVSPRARHPDELELVLSDHTKVRYQFTPPDGVLFESVQAAPYGFALPNGRYTADKDTGLSGPLPKTIRRMLARRVAEDGSVEIIGVPKPLLESVEVSSAKLGKQIVRDNKRSLLVPCGSLSGSIECPPDQLPEDLYVYVSIRGDHRDIAQYRTKTKPDGSFSFPVIPSGRADLEVFWPESSNVIAVPPRNVSVDAKSTKEVRVPVVPVVKLRGRVILADTRAPVKDGMLSIRSKRFPSVSRLVQTDKNGWYEGKMPSGEITTQLFVMSDALSHQYPPTRTDVIPKDVKQCQFDAIEVDPKNEIWGFVIDERGKRARNRHVVIWSPHFGHVDGMCKTNDEGRFRLKLYDWSARRLREALKKKEKGEAQRWELKVLPPIELSEKTPLDDIVAIKEFPTIKVQSFSPVVIQIVETVR